MYKRKFLDVNISSSKTIILPYLFIISVIPEIKLSASPIFSFLLIILPVGLKIAEGYIALTRAPPVARGGVTPRTMAGMESDRGAFLFCHLEFVVLVSVPVSILTRKDTRMDNQG